MYRFIQTWPPIALYTGGINKHHFETGNVINLTWKWCFERHAQNRSYWSNIGPVFLIIRKNIKLNLAPVAFQDQIPTMTEPEASNSVVIWLSEIWKIQRKDRGVRFFLTSQWINITSLGISLSIRLPESRGIWVNSITEYGNARTKCQYVHKIPNT